MRLELIIELLDELADSSYQRRVWLAEAGPEIGSFDEHVSQLFDDTGLGDRLDSGAASDEMSKESIGCLRRLSDMVSGFDRDRPVEVVIDSIEMEQIRRCAKRASDLIKRDMARQG